MRVLRCLGILAVICASLAACTAHQPAHPPPSPVASTDSPRVHFTPIPVRIGAARASVIPATATGSSVLAKLTLTPLPASGVRDAVHNLLPVEVTTKVRELATYGSFVSHAHFTIAGHVSAVAGSPRTALIRVVGPNYNGRRQAAIGPGGIVAATLTLPALAPGRWTVAIEDLSHIHPAAGGLESGYAILDLAIYDVH